VIKYRIHQDMCPESVGICFNFEISIYPISISFKIHYPYLSIIRIGLSTLWLSIIVIPYPYSISIIHYPLSIFILYSPFSIIHIHIYILINISIFHILSIHINTVNTNFLTMVVSVVPTQRGQVTPEVISSPLRKTSERVAALRWTSISSGPSGEKHHI